MKVFFDTNLFIYLWEDHSARAAHVRNILRTVRKADGVLVTSTLSLAEILVHPMRKGASDAVKAYVDRFERTDLISFDATCAVFFADIRARYPAVKPPDAIQLACARRSGCDWFLTNDRRLSELEIRGVGKCASYDSFPAD